MFRELDPLLHSELRLAVMSILAGADEADFVYMREQTRASAGKLQKAGYISVEKGFKGRMPRTVCRMTDAGRKAFEDYVDALRSYIGDIRK